jgi:fermentation-respiration switch protein FrsA (DUF1100 family)
VKLYLISCITLLVLIIAIFIASLYFYNLAIFRKEKKFLSNNDDFSEDISKLNHSGLSWIEKNHCKTIGILSHDGLKLKGYYIESKKESDVTIILVHGYSSKGKHMGFFAEYYYEKLGFNVLMPDLRGHGESEGNYIGFGWHDRLDIIKWINYIVKSKGENEKIFLHGISMGASTVLMTSGEELPVNVKGIISDCAYSSVEKILTYQARKMYGLPKFPVIPATSLLCRLRSGYNFREASAIEQLKKCKLPILFIHGYKDNFVPTSMVHELYNTVNGNKDLLLIEGAGHGASYATNMTEYQRAVKTFIDKILFK